jgi:hypothetical protein
VINRLLWAQRVLGEAAPAQLQMLPDVTAEL